jgi:hypothetical protein
MLDVFHQKSITDCVDSLLASFNALGRIQFTPSQADTATVLALASAFKFYSVLLCLCTLSSRVRWIALPFVLSFSLPRVPHSIDPRGTRGESDGVVEPLSGSVGFESARTLTSPPHLPRRVPPPPFSPSNKGYVTADSVWTAFDNVRTSKLGCHHPMSKRPSHV